MHSDAAKPLRWILLGLCLSILSGCALLIPEPAPPPAYHILTPVPEAEGVAGERQGRPERNAARGGPVVGVAPVSVPDYLDAPQIVVRTTPNTLERADFHVWAAPLADNFARVLADNLGAMIRTDRVIMLPGGTFLRTDFQVAVDVSKFERDVDGNATLVARWSLFGEDGANLIAMRRSVFRQPAPADDYDAIVAALSKTVAQLSEEIAAAIGSRRRAGV